MFSSSDKISISIRKCFGEYFDPSTKHILAVQGCSTSGKTTISECLKQLIVKNFQKCKLFVFSTDCFYKSDPIAKNTSYDYDNPGSLNWNLMFQSLRSLISNEAVFKYSLYDFKTCQRSDVEIANEGYNLIIVEGIFAHAFFNKFTFNFELFDPSDTFKTIKNSFVENANFTFFNENVKILPIFLDLFDETIISNRIKIDERRAGRSALLSEQYTRKFVIRSTSDWVRSTMMPESICINREVNKECIIILIHLLGIFFNVNEDVNAINNLVSSILSKLPIN